MDNEYNIIDNQCVICLENIESIPETFKFPCEHKNFMHTECVNHLNNCPLCRINSNGNYIVIGNNNFNSTNNNGINTFLIPNYFFYIPHFLILLILLFFFLLILVQSFIIYDFDNNINNNSTNVINVTI